MLSRVVSCHVLPYKISSVGLGYGLFSQGMHYKLRHAWLRSAEIMPGCVQLSRVEVYKFCRDLLG